MRNVRQLLRLTVGEGLFRSRVSVATGVLPSTITDCLTRARAAGLGWPLPADLEDAELEARLYRPPGGLPVARPLPDWSRVHHELHRPGAQG